MEWQIWFTWWIIFFFRPFDYIIKKHTTITNNPPANIYANKIKNRIVFKINAGYKLLGHETIKLLGSTRKDIDQDKDGDNAPKL